MPIFEFGYRSWDGARTPLWSRWLPITLVEIRLAYKNSAFLRRLMFMAWAPLLYFGPLFFAIGAVTEPQKTIEASAPGGPPNARGFTRRVSLLSQFTRGVLPSGVAEQLEEHPNEVRPLAWTIAFHLFLSTTTGLALLLVVLIVGPKLISRDSRDKSFLLYFSKPITKWDYLGGKFGAILGFVAFVSMGPALALYALSIGFSPNWRTFIDTLSVFWRIPVATLVVVTPMAMVMLFFSSLSRDPRFAAGAFITLCLMGEVFYRAFQLAPQTRDLPWTFMVSPREVAVVAISAILDIWGQLDALGIELPKSFFLPKYNGLVAIGELVGITAISFLGLSRRVTAPIRI